MLTQLERKVLDSIQQYFAAHEHSPTIAEIAGDVGLQSRGTVHRYVQALIAKGYLDKEGAGWRGLRVIDAPQDTKTPAIDLSARSDSSARQTERAEQKEQTEQNEQTEQSNLRIPLLGKIAAGLPIEAISNEEHLDLAEFFIGPDRYALRVTGDSMMDVGILDADTVIVRKQSTAKTGDIVVALIDAQEATLKRLGEYSGGLIELIPENSGMSVMRYAAHRVALQGVVVGQMRSY